MKIKSVLSRLTIRFSFFLFSLIILGFTFVPVYNYFRGLEHTKDYGKLYHVGQTVLDNGDIYTKRKDNMFAYMYPPMAAVLLAPLSALGALPFILVLTLITSFSWIGSVALSVYLIIGKDERYGAHL
ncbi:MAG: hypothetical protein MRJ65_03935 [Candidatus Brocadiaceae bacterium]|nr:hypothetical protein [Candidatus Brocadiaceae bacterium]